MTKKPPPKHHRNVRGVSVNRTTSLEDEVAGKLFRVRDRDWTTVWGEDLSWDDAVKLKESVVGRRKSTTARVESMDIERPQHLGGDVSAAPTRGADQRSPALSAPELRAAYNAGLAAAREAANAAQKRADALAASRPPATTPTVPFMDAPEGDPGTLSAGEIDDLLGDDEAVSP